MENDHFAFILAAFGMTFVVVVTIMGAIVADYRRLLRELAQLAPRVAALEAGSARDERDA